MSKITKAACMPVNLLWVDICSLGSREGVEEAAEPQEVGDSVELWNKDHHQKHTVNKNDVLLPMEDNSITERLLGATYTAEKKDAAAARALDQVVDVAGSRFFFGGVLGVITGWAIAGGITGAPDIWQIIFQDVSSIQCYISDMILMRQQQNDFREHLRIIALLRSRSYTITKCFRLLIEQDCLMEDPAPSSTLRSLRNLDVANLAHAELARISAQEGGGIAIQENNEEETLPTTEIHAHGVFHDVEKDAKELDALGRATTLVPENFIDRVIVVVTDVMGSAGMLFVFITGIAVWVGLGTLYV
jgi:low affinity Fe/Cu permease